MNIPIQNIYYLLCYAWNKLEEKDRVSVNVDDKTSLLDLFAKVLINATRILLKRGIDRSYTPITSDIPGVKGKIQISETIKRHLLAKQRTLCTFDEFSSNILLNQILFTTIRKLIYVKDLDENLRNELRTLGAMFNGVQTIEMKASIFSKVKVNRNNKIYGFVMNVCQIVLENTLPSEEPGKLRFNDFTRDEIKMNQLFESFIRNFYKKEQRKFTIVRREGIKWQFQSIDLESKKHIPGMETDITLENDIEKIIIDAKFYKETLSSYYNSEKIHSNNLYQVFSYLINQQSDERTKKAKGILLYPTINKEYNLNYKYQEHDIQVKTIDLNANWRKIDMRLKEIIGVTSL